MCVLSQSSNKLSKVQIESWMHEAGMQTWTDAVANVHGRIHGQKPETPALLIGSHYDTVKDAGKYDGALGILAGIAAVKALVVQVRAAAVHTLATFLACCIGAAHGQVSGHQLSSSAVIYCCEMCTATLKS